MPVAIGVQINMGTPDSNGAKACNPMAGKSNAVVVCERYNVANLEAAIVWAFCQFGGEVSFMHVDRLFLVDSGDVDVLNVARAKVVLFLTVTNNEQKAIVVHRVTRDDAAQRWCLYISNRIAK